MPISVWKPPPAPQTAPRPSLPQTVYCKQKRPPKAAEGLQAELEVIIIPRFLLHVCSHHTKELWYSYMLGALLTRVAPSKGTPLPTRGTAALIRMGLGKVSSSTGFEAEAPHGLGSNRRYEGIWHMRRAWGHQDGDPAAPMVPNTDNALRSEMVSVPPPLPSRHACFSRKSQKYPKHWKEEVPALK